MEEPVREVAAQEDDDVVALVLGVDEDEDEGEREVGAREEVVFAQWMEDEGAIDADVRMEVVHGVDDAGIGIEVTIDVVVRTGDGRIVVEAMVEVLFKDEGGTERDAKVEVVLTQIKELVGVVVGMTVISVDGIGVLVGTMEEMLEYVAAVLGT